jgi:putative modified peptide
MSKIRFDETVARTLVRLLASDDDFRAAFSADPVSTLEQYGLSPVDGYASARLNARCLMVGKLASKDEIQEARLEIDRMLTSGISQITPALDAELSAARLLKAVA